MYYRGIVINMKKINELEVMLDAWLDRDIRPTSAASYRKWLRAFFAWYGKRSTPINVAAVVDYKNHCLSDLDLSPRTVRNRLAALRGFCSYLVKSGVLRNNPVLDIRLPRIDTKRHARESLTVEQVKALLQAVSDSGSIRDCAVLHLVVLQGLRVAEVSRLNCSDIKELDGNWTISIKGKGMDGKISQPIQEQCRQALCQILELRTSEPLFVSRSGERCSPDRISRICKHWLRASGLDDSRITAHSLRHTFATLVLAQGGGLEVVSKMLRHSHLSTTMIYAHIDPKALSEQFEKLGDVLNDGKSNV